MAGTLQFDLVSPERSLASLPVDEVQIPGADGDMTAMEGHAPTITTLRPGILRAISSGATQAFVVTGGFAEVSATGVSVLAERAIPKDDASGELLDELVQEARDMLENAEDKDAADKLVNDLLALRTSLNS
ncbi:MAG: F0F1 ATP synthase subunit epsilon [Pseudorhodobacter sp.]